MAGKQSHWNYRLPFYAPQSHRCASNLMLIEKQFRFKLPLLPFALERCSFGGSNIRSFTISHTLNVSCFKIKFEGKPGWKRRARWEISFLLRWRWARWGAWRKRKESCNKSVEFFNFKFSRELRSFDGKLFLLLHMIRKRNVAIVKDLIFQSEESSEQKVPWKSTSQTENSRLSISFFHSLST